MKFEKAMPSVRDYPGILYMARESDKNRLVYFQNEKFYESSPNYKNWYSASTEDLIASDWQLYVCNLCDKPVALDEMKDGNTEDIIDFKCYQDTSSDEDWSETEEIPEEERNVPAQSPEELMSRIEGVTCCNTKTYSDIYNSEHNYGFIFSV